jgi:hypothetical protein
VKAVIAAFFPALATKRDDITELDCILNLDIVLALWASCFSIAKVMDVSSVSKMLSSVSPAAAKMLEIMADAVSVSSAKR